LREFNSNPIEASKDVSKDSGGTTMNFKFESLKDLNLINGTSYFMDFGEAYSAEYAAIVEGKLLSAFGEPARKSENYEGSFDYVIRATADDGNSVILAVYGMGDVHIGADNSLQEDFVRNAAYALIEHVNAFEPTDFSRTVYYSDFNVKIDIQVKDGVATIHSSKASGFKIFEILIKWFGRFFER
jgi:hypothetical protein